MFFVLFYITYPLYLLCLACYFSSSPTASLLFWTFYGTVLTRLYGSMVVYHKKWVRGNIYRACLLRRLVLYSTDFPITFRYISHSSSQARTHVYENLNFRVRIASRVFGNSNNDVDIYIIYDVCSRNIMNVCSFRISHYTHTTFIGEEVYLRVWARVTKQLVGNVLVINPTTPLYPHKIPRGHQVFLMYMYKSPEGFSSKENEKTNHGTTAVSTHSSSPMHRNTVLRFGVTPNST